MPTYQVTLPDGRKVTITKDSPPTDEDLAEIGGGPPEATAAAPAAPSATAKGPASFGSQALSTLGGYGTGVRESILPYEEGHPEDIITGPAYAAAHPIESAGLLGEAAVGATDVMADRTTRALDSLLGMIPGINKLSPERRAAGIAAGKQGLMSGTAGIGPAAMFAAAPFAAAGDRLASGDPREMGRGVGGLVGLLAPMLLAKGSPQVAGRAGAPGTGTLPKAGGGVSPPSLAVPPAAAKPPVPAAALSPESLATKATPAPKKMPGALADYMDRGWDINREFKAGGKSHGLDKIIDKAEPITKDTTFYRVISGKRHAEAVNSGKYEPPGFVSLGDDAGKLEEFAGLMKESGMDPATVEVRVPAGIKVLDISKEGGSKRFGEHILPRGSKFRVTKEGDRTIMTLEPPKAGLPTPPEAPAAVEARSARHAAQGMAPEQRAELAKRPQLARWLKNPEGEGSFFEEEPVRAAKAARHDARRASDALGAELSTLPKYKGVSYRGEPMTQEAIDAIGNEYSFDKHTSATLDRDSAYAYSQERNAPGQLDVVFEIEGSPADTKPFNPAGSAREVIFKGGTKFDVLSKSAPDAEGLVTVKLREKATPPPSQAAPVPAPSKPTAAPTSPRKPPVLPEVPKTLGETLRSSALVTFERALESTFPGKAPFGKFRTTQNKALADDMAGAVVKHISDFSGSKQQLGDNIRSAIAKGREGMMAHASRLYGEVDKLAGKSKVGTNGIKPIARQMETMLTKLEKLAPASGFTETKALIAKLKAAPPVIDFQTAHQYRSLLLGKTRALKGEIADQAGGFVKQLTKAIDGAMETSARKTPGLEKAYREANAFYREGQETFVRSLVAKMGRKRPRGFAHEMIVGAAPEEIAQVKKALPKKEWQALKAQVLEDALEEATKGEQSSALKGLLSQISGGVIGEPMHGPQLSGSRLRAQLEAPKRFGEERLRAVFEPDELAGINKLMTTADEIGAEPRSILGSFINYHMIYKGGDAAMRAMSGDVTGLFELGAQYGSIKLLSKVLATKRGADAYTRYMKAVGEANKNVPASLRFKVTPRETAATKFYGRQLSALIRQYEAEQPEAEESDEP